MARKRMIDPTIWADEDFGSLSYTGQIFYIGLISNADDEGRLPGSPLFLTSTIFPYKGIGNKDAKLMRDEIFTKMKSVVLYEIDGKEYIQFKNWRLYQSINKPTASKYPPLPKDYCSTTVGLPPNRIEKNRKEENRNNGVASPESETKKGAIAAVGDILKERFQLTTKKTGISTQWQDKAFRYAEKLEIRLPNDLKSRWLKAFKETSIDNEKAKKLEKAFSYLVDYYPFKSLGSSEKVMYFFKVYENGIQNRIQSGYINLQALILGVICTTLLLLFPVLAKQPERVKTTVQIEYTVNSQYATTEGVDSDNPRTVKGDAVLRPTLGSLQPPVPKTEVEQIICKYFGRDCNMAIAIAKAESGLRCSAIGDGHLDPHSYGVFQIRALAGRPSYDQLLDCETNIAWAYRMFKTQGWNPWSVYTNGRYQFFFK